MVRLQIGDRAKSVKITVLVENSVSFPFLPGNIPGMLGEHGLALLIDSGEDKVLYDTGRGRTLNGNLELAGVRPGDAGKVVISHGHRDHTGALLSFIRRNGKTEVHCHPGNFMERYGKNGPRMNDIGNPFNGDELEEAGARLVFSDQPVAVGPGIVISGYIPRIHKWELNQGNFFKKDGETFIPDDFADEQAVFIRTAAGLVVVTGCGHAGIINTLEHAVNLFGNVKILAVVGGLHLSGVSPERIGLTLEHLGRFDPGRLLVGHCTGFEPTCRLWQEFGDRVAPLNVGKQIEF